MRTTFIKIGLPVLAVMFLLSSCTPPLSMTTWKNPNANDKVSKVVVLVVFDKLNIIKPYEEAVAAYLNSKGVKAISAITFLVPFQQYTKEQLAAKLDSLGADGILIFTYKGTDVSVNYSPPTYYGFYAGGWARAGWGVAGSPGYWSTDQNVNVRANLYWVKSQELLWTGDLTYFNPSDAYAAGTQAGQQIFTDWQKNAVVNAPPPASK
jgi:hypothetical protein